MGFLGGKRIECSAIGAFRAGLEAVQIEQVSQRQGAEAATGAQQEFAAGRDGKDVRLFVHDWNIFPIWSFNPGNNADANFCFPL